jgi:hypothetical protein
VEPVDQLGGEQPRRLKLTPAGNEALHRLGIRLEVAADNPKIHTD